MRGKISTISCLSIGDFQTFRETDLSMGTLFQNAVKEPESSSLWPSRD